VIRDHPRENVEASRRAFGIGKARKLRRQRKRFLYFGDINASDLQHSALGEVYRMQHEAFNLLFGSRLRARQKARAHPEGAPPKPQV
jgi:hypothetical protein